MLIVVNFTITAMSLWVQSGHPETASTGPRRDSGQVVRNVKKDGGIDVAPAQSAAIAERKLFLPLVFVIGAHFLGVVPLYVFNHSSEKVFALSHKLSKRY
jgi:glycosylphosphatidylinositol transamidase